PRDGTSCGSVMTTLAPSTPPAIHIKQLRVTETGLILPQAKRGFGAMTPVETALVTLAGVVVLLFLILLIVGGGKLGRFGLAFQAFQRALRDQAFAEKVQPLLAPGETKTQATSKPSGAPLRLI